MSHKRVQLPCRGSILHDRQNNYDVRSRSALVVYVGVCWLQIPQRLVLQYITIKINTVLGKLVYIGECVHLLHLEIFTTSLLLLLIMSSSANVVLTLFIGVAHSYAIYSWCYTPSWRWVWTPKANPESMISYLLTTKCTINLNHASSLLGNRQTS